MIKIIYITLLLVFSNVWCQTETEKRDSLKIETNRQVFWENLPKPTNWTNDYENLFTQAEENKLNSIITEFEEETTIEIGIVTIDTLKTSYENFNKLSLHIAQTWGVGKKGKDNGILIVISNGHRKIRIEHGNGIEKIISEKETSAIIENYFIPEFKKGDYYKATLNGLLEIIKLLKSKL